MEVKAEPDEFFEEKRDNQMEMISGTEVTVAVVPKEPKRPKRPEKKGAYRLFTDDLKEQKGK